MPKRFPLVVLAVALVAICLASAPAYAQLTGGVSVGNIYGKAVDEQGAVLPGVSATLSGVGAPQTVTSDARGEYRFLNLAPGKYTIKLELSGFATVTRENVVVNYGKNTEITETMKLSSVAAAVTVTSETPVIDTRKVQTGAVMTQEELKSIPTSRDPWVMLQGTPGVMVDRVNVAGSESGQQSAFNSKGTVAGSFTVDGVNFTDMNALGASDGYYDFETFQEIQVVTGGSDPALQGAGAHINMITKRGTNEVHGSARINYVSNNFEGTNYPPTAGRRNIQSIQEYGVEVGGPIVKDMLWLWGAYGRNQININVGAGTPPTKSQTTLENLNAKLNFQAIPSNSFNAWYQHSNKLVFGRGAGANRPQAATTDQTLPYNAWKAEDSQVVSSNFFFDVVYSGLNGFFGLTPEGKGQLGYDGTVFSGTSPYYLAQTQPQWQLQAHTSFFFNTGSLGHELKAGFTYLTVTTNLLSGSPANPAPASNPNQAVKVGWFTNVYTDPTTGAPVPAAGIFRDAAFGITGNYYGAYLGDTMTWDRLTVQVGVRWDQQSGVNAPAIAAANPSYPDILPSINYAGAPKDFTWTNWSPRVGLTYALGQNRQTVLKASYAKFCDALGTTTISYTNPLGGSAGAYYPWNDANGNGVVDVGEVNTSGPLLANYGYNLQNPGSAGVSANAVNHDLKAGTTDEFVGGIDYEITPGFAVGGAYTYRKYINPVVGLPYDPTTGTIVTNADYEQYTTLSGTLPNGTPYSNVPVYQINAATLAAIGGYPGGFYYTNRGDYNQTYSGFDVTLTKRLSNKWMARASFSWGINKQSVGANGCPGDPNNGPIYKAPYGFVESPTQTTCRDGDYVSQQSAGSGSHYSVFLNSNYTYNLNAMYQLPLDFNIAASFFGRQGYPVNYYINTTAPGDGQTRAIPVVPVNDVRYPTLNELDLRLEKVIPFAQTASVTVALDCFNALNASTILQKQNRLAISSTDVVREVQNPWVLRWSARVSW
jgi:carboxypeptidase family protein/TonB-dependent receptor-like protein